MFVYGTLCALMIIVEISGGLAAYVYRHDVHHELVSVLNKTITEQYGINNSTTAAIDTLQKGLHCCGAQSFEDWSSTVWSTSGIRGSNQVPDSCCKTVSRLCGVRDHPSNIYYTGCGESLGSLASTHLLLLGSVALTVALIQIFGVVFSCKLGKTMKNLED
ncbi:CD151 antigen [Eurytemora carolleeae]|uniref:CD151 antigen n=1 Tax=Eurytemora carolleeae TaxID=1294199 RepID=UPI000C785CFB|nr:CD151 antigen [Eurytemora carolleeae]|eukprot:XP_023332388.1 CD151 antigen-like [Eurytemora affinis]